MTQEQAELIDEALSFLLDQSFEREDGFEEEIQAATAAAYAAVINPKRQKRNEIK
jgi:hypothetical protein